MELGSPKIRTYKLATRCEGILKKLLYLLLDLDVNLEMYNY